MNKFETAMRALRPVLPRVAATASACLGCIVLVGWVLDQPTLRSVLPGAVEMKANTAVALIASSVALWLRTVPAKPLRNVLALALSVFVALLGAATLLQYLSGSNLGIDQSLVRDHGEAFNAAKGRMSPFSASAFVCLGLALAAMRSDMAAHLPRALGGFVLVIGMLSFLGYLWNASELVTDKWVPPVAINTAWAFMLLGGAVASARDEVKGGRPPSARSEDGIGLRVVLAFGAAALLLVVGGGYTYRSGSEFAETTAWISEAQHVRAQLSRLYGSISDAESAQRNYVLIGKRIFRDRFADEARQADENLAVLQALTRSDPAQQRAIEDLSVAVAKRIRTLAAATEMYEKLGEPAARQLIATERGVREMQQIRSVSDEIDHSVIEAVRQRQVQMQERRSRTLLSLLITLGLVMGLFAVLLRSIRREIRARAAADARLLQLNADLERRVDERTADLVYQQAFLRRVIDLNEGFIFAKDRDGRFVLANAAVAEGYGTTVANLIGKTDGDFNPNADEVERFRSIDRKVIDSGRQLTIPEEEFTDASGRLRWLYTMKRPIVMPGGEATMILGTSYDITDRKLAEAEIGRLTGDLERRVDERTTQLREANLALQESRLAAEEGSRAKSAFLAAMSHEIRTPMNGVIGMAEVLSRARLEEGQADAVRTIRASAFALLGIVDDILDFSKIEAGRLELEHSPVRLAEVIEGVCDTLLPLASDKRVELSLFVDPRLPVEIRSDETRLRQILFNLVGNAVKFSAAPEERRGRVTVRAVLAAGASQRLALSVADNGIGMSAETLAGLFTPFTQAEASTTRRFGGTGLGLAICERLVTLMDGDIAVHSEIGNGATFSVTLPIDPADGAIDRAYPDLDGVDCIIVGSDIDAEDLQVYLNHAGARVQRTNDLTAATERAGALTRPVVIHNARRRNPAPESLGPAFATRGDVRHLLIARGRRRQARTTAQNVVVLDGNALRRASLLHAVAVAAGRASPEVQQYGDSDLALGDLASAPTVTEARTQNRLVLIAEDDEVNQKVILRQIEMLGYAAEMAANGIEALRLWRSGPYAVLLTDLHMPGMDGYSLAESIRADEAKRGVAPEMRMPILALTANALRGEEIRALAAGMDEYLTKPLQLKMLGAALERWLPKDGANTMPSELLDLPDPPASEPVVDERVLHDQVGNDPAVVREVLRDYMASAERHAKDLRLAQGASDIRGIGFIAHKLKSSSRSIGARSLGDACAELENACLNGVHDDVSLRLDRVDTALRAVRNRLRERLG